MATSCIIFPIQSLSSCRKAVHATVLNCSVILYSASSSIMHVLGNWCLKEHAYFPALYIHIMVYAVFFTVKLSVCRKIIPGMQKFPYIVPFVLQLISFRKLGATMPHSILLSKAFFNSIWKKEEDDRVVFTKEVRRDGFNFSHKQQGKQSWFEVNICWGSTTDIGGHTSI